MGERRRRRSETLEGRHGTKTHRRLLRQLEAGPDAGTPEREGPQRAAATDHPRRDGGARLVEDRQQHDEADKNSDANRLQKDLQRGRRTAGADVSRHASQSRKS